MALGKRDFGIISAGLSKMHGGVAVAAGLMTTVYGGAALAARVNSGRCLTV
ncbi:MAG: hypothetical protein U5K75_02285 [Ahrensia sp.]|nr:hypothetical protein [Ahrensia sp.]